MPADAQQSTTVARLAADEATARRIIDIVTESYDPLAAVAGVSEDGPGRWAVAIHFRDPPNETAVRALVALSAGPDAANELWFETTTPRDWVKASHEGLKPIEAGRFVVHTPHYRGHAPLNRIAIEIEASLAFGTGHHGTTRGCLLALDRIVKLAKKRRRISSPRNDDRPIRSSRKQHAHIFGHRERSAGVGKSRATAFPPPLRGRDREGGTTSTVLVFNPRPDRASPPSAFDILVCAEDKLRRRRPVTPPSLSLPRKGGGNGVARTFATHGRRTLRCVHALARKGGGSRPSSPRPQWPFTLAARSRAQTVLDIGTGTGVLAIAAARALRCRVMASDIDPVAVKVARANVRLNRAAGLVELMRADGLGVRRLAGRYDLVLANILLAPLQRMATPIARNLAPGGRVVLSGLLRGQAVAALTPYIARGLILKERIPLEGWMTLVLERRAGRNMALRHKAHRQKTPRRGVAARRSAQ